VRLWLPPALEVPRMRLYALGHGISVLGSWIQSTALAWLVFRLTGSVSMLGVMGFLLQIPFLVLGPITGSVVDRLPRLKLLIVIDVLLACVSFGLALLAWFEVKAIWPYFLAAVLHGALNAFEMPTRQALLARIVEDRALVPSALGVSATLFNAGRLVGPAIAGVALLFVSETWCFVANGFSNLFIIWTLLKMGLGPGDRAAATSANRPGLLEGLAVLSELPAVRYLVPMMAMVGLCGVPYVHLMPSIAATFFGGQSSTYGTMMSAAGFGALAAALFLSMQRGIHMQRRIVALAPLVLGLGFIGLALSRSFVLSLVLLTVIGAAVMCSANATNVLLQQSVPDDWRGRVVGLYAMSFQGLGPIGTLFSGFVAHWIGLAPMLVINAICLIVAAVLIGGRLRANPEVLTSIGAEPAEMPVAARRQARGG